MQRRGLLCLYGLVSGGGWNDVLMGGEGDDTLRGSDGHDILSGGGGNDELDARGGETWDMDFIDLLEGGSGNDTYIVGESGIDFVNDQEGSNTIRFQPFSGSTFQLSDLQLYFSAKKMFVRKDKST